MANPFRNEQEIKLGGQTLLLRPTFENIANLEAQVGGLPNFAMKLSKSELPQLTDLAKVIFYCHVKVDGVDRKMSLEEIWDLVLGEGMFITNPVLSFVAKITAGDKTQVELSEKQKKS